MAAPLHPKIQDLVARLNRDPESKIFLQLAEEYRKAGLLEEALLVCKAGLKKHPGYQSARVALGRVYVALGRQEEARAEFETVVRASPENLLANRLLGDVLALLGNSAGARERYRAVIALGPADNEIRDKLEALERGEDPRRVARMGSEGAAAAAAAPARPAPGPPVPSARSAPSVRPASPVAPPGPAAAPVAAPPRATAPAAASSASPATAPGLRRVLPPEGKPAARPERHGVNTPTLAEIYARQGHTDRAIEIYERVVAADPDDERSRARLAELRRSAPEPELAAVAAPAGRRERRGGSTAEVVGRLERWLRSIQGGRP
jgi:tetratricopeptide (TPR) repeat protein